MMTAQRSTSSARLQLSDRVSRFVAAQVGVPSKQLTPETTMLGDLGVDGQDGAELMEAFAREFGVDLSSFDHRLHFGPEAGANPFSVLTQLYLWVTQRSLSPEARNGLVPIRVRDLIDAAALKRWVSRTKSNAPESGAAEQ